MLRSGESRKYGAAENSNTPEAAREPLHGLYGCATFANFSCMRRTLNWL